MLKKFKLAEISVEEIIRQDPTDFSEVESAAASIVADVKARGDEAVREYTLRFDGYGGALKVSEEEIASARKSVDGYFTETLRQAADNIRVYHEKQLRKGYEIRSDGIVLGQKITPLNRVGIYVPGGTASYPSTVLMNAVPAGLAGVKEIVMVTPVGKDGKIREETLAAAALAGVTEIYKIGGAQAVAALAYGTESVKKVDKIVGPGNAYVAAAKKLVFGQVDIDMIAGPSEILVIADASADPSFVACDLLSQAEHDRNASAVLVTDSEALADAVTEELNKRLPLLPRKEIAESSLKNNGKIIIAETMEDAVAAANAIAPEHLELIVKDPFALLNFVKNAGSVFLGGYSPEPLGDYLAGTNHTLPTGGTARFSSPLSVDDFVKKFSYIRYEKAALAEVSDRIADFAEREGLTAHADAVRVRFAEEK